MIAKKRKGSKSKKHGAKPGAQHRGIEAENRPDVEARVRGYERLMVVEERLYEVWEKRTGGQMDWVGEVLRGLVDEEPNLWLAAVGDKVAALGGHLELVAVLPDETVVLLREPGLHSDLTDDEDGKGEAG